ELNQISWLDDEANKTEQRLTTEQIGWLLDKILVPRSRAVERFKFEMNAKQTIRLSLADVKRNRLPGIVNIVGGTDKFQSFEAYKNLSAFFKTQRTQISNYALVMEKYDCTLKDLLERGYHISGSSGSTGEEKQTSLSNAVRGNQARVGYKRMEEVLPFSD